MDRGEPVELDPLQRRLDVQAYYPFVTLVCCHTYGVLDAVLEPRVQIIANIQVLRIESETIILVGDFLCQFARYLNSRLAVDRLTLAPGRRIGSILGHPSAVLATAYAALAVSPLTHLRFCIRTS